MQKRIIRKALDKCHEGRDWLMTSIVYLSLWIYGSEISWQNLIAKRSTLNVYANLNLDGASSLDLLLNTAREGLEVANRRRDGVLDKCKTLLALISILLTIIGLLTAKLLPAADVWISVGFGIALLPLVNSLAMLLVCSGIRTEMRISLDQCDVNLQPEDLKKSLINSYLQCLSYTDNRIDYLLEIFKAARFFFQVSAVFALLLFVIALRPQTIDDPIKSAVSQLRDHPISIKVIK